jgi:hypothetical protein
MGMSVDLMGPDLKSYLDELKKRSTHEVQTFCREDRIDFIDPEDVAMEISKSNGLIRPTFLMH